MVQAVCSIAILLLNGVVSSGFVYRQNQMTLAAEVQSRRRVQKTPVYTEPSIAHVTDMQGMVKVKRRSSRLEEVITITTFLREGDTVKTGARGRAQIYQAYTRAEALMPNTSKVIKRQLPASGTDVIDSEKYARLEADAILALKNMNSKSPGRMSGPDELTVTALAPRESVVLSDRPTFEWTPVKNAESYEVKLFDSKEDVIWQEITKESHLMYPDPRTNNKIMPLLPGKPYTWRVTAYVDQKPKVRDDVKFTIAGEWQITATRYALKIAKSAVRDKNATNLFYISACIDLQQYPNAEAELKRSLVRKPEDMTLWALLMQVYDYMGRYEDRNKIFDYLRDPNSSDLKQILRSEPAPATNKRAFRK